MSGPRAAQGGAPPPIPRTLVLVGLMGAGKSAIGRRLAQRLGLPFIDADHEVEAAAGRSIDEIFHMLGEAEFREGERRVMKRLLEGPVCVLASGGGGFMDPGTRALVRERAVSIWLKAELDVLLARVGRRGNRPLLKSGDPREILTRLIAERYPTYAEADIHVESAEGPPEMTVEHVIGALRGLFPAAAVATTP